MLEQILRSATVIGALALAAIGPATVSAQERGASVFETTEIVPRLGVTLGPEQFVVGVGFILAGIADITHLEARPGIDLGFGDHQTTLRASANLGYSVPTSGGDVRVTPEVGISVQYSSFDVTSNGESVRSDSDTNLGLNLGAAAQAGDLIFEAMIGLGHISDISITVGIGIG